MEYKGYEVVTAGNPNYKRIKSIGKGSIPMVLTGLYTTESEATKAIDIQKSNEAASKPNAKKQSNG